MKSQTKRIIISAILTLIFAFIVFYLTLPAINLQSTGFWLYLFSCIVFYFASSIITKIISERKTNKSAKVDLKLKKNRKTVISGLILTLPLLVLAIGSLISSTLFNASRRFTLATASRRSRRATARRSGSSPQKPRIICLLKLR